LEIGPLGKRIDDAPDARPHGWRHLTIYSAWRLDAADHVICDWNFTGGAKGEIMPLIQTLVGRKVESAVANAPGWDLRIALSGRLTLVTFSDSNDERDDVWMILGTDGLELGAVPVYGPAHPSRTNEGRGDE
jgi:hypothetical protein